MKNVSNIYIIYGFIGLYSHVIYIACMYFIILMKQDGLLKYIININHINTYKKTYKKESGSLAPLYLICSLRMSKY